MAASFSDALQNSPRRRSASAISFRIGSGEDVLVRGVLCTRRGTTVGVRCQDEMLAAVDDWRRKQPDLPTRATAIRRLAEIGLKAKK